MTHLDKFAFIILFYCANNADVRHWWFYSDLTVRFMFCPLVTFRLPGLLSPPEEKRNTVLSSWVYLCVFVYMWVCFCVELCFRPLSGFDPGFNPAPIDRPFRPDYAWLLSLWCFFLPVTNHRPQECLWTASQKWYGQLAPVRCSRARTNRASKLFWHGIALSIHTICSAVCSDRQVPTSKDKTR